MKRLICAAAAFVMMFTLIAFVPGVNAESSTYNYFNKQDNKEVPYDGSKWVQPVDWNCPTVRPRDYQGGIMIFFDKIGIEPKSAGKVQRVYVSVHSATDPVSMMKFHIFYDTRLTVKENSKGKVVTAGKAVQGFDTGSAMVEEGQLAFYAYSPNDVKLDNSNLFTIDFIIPENAQEGDVYPIGMSYVDDGIVYDLFIDNARSEEGKLQMSYVFQKGIYNGYIKIMSSESFTAPDSSSIPDSSSPDSTSILDSSSPDKTAKLGDVNGDGNIDVEDAVQVIGHVNGQKALTDDESKRADTDRNNVIDIEDAVAIISHINGVKAIG